jgi:hypothetical protein
VIALFREVPIGERFEFYGVRYRKEAPSMAVDEKQLGNIFMDETVVTVADGVPLFQGPMQPEPYWEDHLTPSYSGEEILRMQKGEGISPCIRATAAGQGG